MLTSNPQARFRTLRTLMCWSVIVLFTAACAGPGGGRGPGGPGGPGGGDRRGPPGAQGDFAKRGGGGPRQSAGDFSYSKALALKNEGACEEAVPLLKRLAERGHGYEIAQYHLGDCLLTLAAEDENGEGAVLHEVHGFYWLLKAGNSNNADAQGKLAALYLEGDVVPLDRVAAAKWYLLYMRNPIQLKIGAMPLAPGLEQYLLDELREQEWAEATTQADEWVVVKQEIVQPTDGRPGRGGRDRDGNQPRRLSEAVQLEANG